MIVRPRTSTATIRKIGSSGERGMLPAGRLALAALRGRPGALAGGRRLAVLRPRRAVARARRIDRGLELLHPLAQLERVGAQPLDLVAQVAQLLLAPLPLVDVAHHLLGAPAQAAVELAFDHPAQGRD